MDEISSTTQQIISGTSQMPQAEKLQMLRYGEASVAPKKGLVHGLFERQVLLTPYSHAVQFEQEPPISFATLNKLSNRLSRQIRTESHLRVAIHMLRSVNLIVAMLATLKAGAAYIILDPDTSLTRKSFILEDTSTTLILVDNDTAGAFQNEQNVPDLLVQSTNCPDGNLFTNQEPSNLAYIIYTSGSLGKPKGVLIEHQAAFNGLSSSPKIDGLRQLLFYNPTFSAAQRTIWATLITGGCLCLATKENLTVNTSRMIVMMGVTSVDITPSAVVLLSPDHVPSLRRIIIAGEIPKAIVVETWAHRVELYSTYGLSECTQLNSRYRLRSGANHRKIGKSIDTTTSYILHPGTTTLTPLLVSGELCLGGGQLARGYLNNQEETARKFIRNPFGEGKLHRTGDFAVRHTDGFVEILGRIDLQVKINGQKVDPGESNALIQTDSNVKDSTVISALNNERTVLVAVIVSRDPTNWSISVKRLQQSLVKHLSPYSIPNFWVPLDELPRNANSKVDITAIREIVESLGKSGQLLPVHAEIDNTKIVLTANEQLIQRLWAEYLAIPESKIGLDDSFVSLGGSSLEAIQVVSRLQSAHSLNLRVEDVILSRSLSSIASLLKPASVDSNEDRDILPFSLIPKPPNLGHLGIQQSDIEDAFPVTSFQEGVIADTMMGGTDYIYSRAYSFAGYSTESIKSVLSSLMESEIFLRTTFVTESSSFLQVVLKLPDLPLEVRELGFRKYLEGERLRIMLPGELWWRAAIVRSDILVLTTHHALFDFWSNHFFSQDISRLLLGHELVHRSPFRQYVSYLEHQDRKAMEEFWTSYLDGAMPTQIHLESAPSNIVSTTWDFDLKILASKLDVTPSVLLYAAWAIVLANCGDSDDVVFGITLSGRDAPLHGILELSGPTVLITPLRIRVDRAASLQKILTDVRARLWEVAAHASYGLRNILMAAQKSRDIFNTMVNVLVKPVSTLPTGGLELLPEGNSEIVRSIKLEINYESLDRVTLASTLEPEYAQHLVNSVVEILRTISESPSTETGLLDVFHDPKASAKDSDSSSPQSTPTDSEDIDSETSEDSCVLLTSPVSEESVFDLAYSAFFKCAAIYPSKVAVLDVSGASITYTNLATKIRQFASFLSAKGVVREQAIPIMLQKSINTVIAIFGILLAGAVFVPLDPENPVERNVGIIEDVDASLVILDGVTSVFSTKCNCQCVIMDDVDWEKAPSYLVDNSGLTPSNLAYIIFTSGSTGRPKGTLLTHSGLSAAIEGMVEATELTSSCRALWALNYVFDGSLATLFPTLSTGGTLCFAPQDGMMPNLASMINNMNINHLSVTPTIASLLNPDEVPTLQVLIVGGEPLSPYILEVWSPRLKVFSEYGPTEASICVTVITVTPDMNPRNIGRPLKHASIIILDSKTLETVHPGETGELCLSGKQLARGYLKLPEQTVDVFRTLQDGTRVYVTGDLARWLPNGEIELLGRKDDQIKLNGHRIELGEVESVLMKSNLFKKCVVVAATILKKKQLVAFYLVPNAIKDGRNLLSKPAKASAQDFASMLGPNSLSRHMIPNLWLPVSEFPVTPSGKIDRRNILEFVEDLDKQGTLLDYLPHECLSKVESENEKVMQASWCGLFDKAIDKIHANSSFHVLGGDSISAISLVNILRRKGYKIDVKDVLSYPLLREQAALLIKISCPKEAPKSQIEAHSLEYQPPKAAYEQLAALGVSNLEVEDIYPCGPGQIEFLGQGNKKESFWHLMAVRSLPVNFDFDRWVYLTTKLTRQNPILRSFYLHLEEDTPQSPVQVVLRHSLLNLSNAYYGTELEKRKILDAEWNMPFEPTKPAVRYTLMINIETGARDLVTKIDHASYDGTLFHIFDKQFKELQQMRPIQQNSTFKEFVNYAILVPKPPQIAYWTNTLLGKSFDFPELLENPIIYGGFGETARISISTAIQSLAESCNVTASIVFQTAYTLLLAHLSKSKAITYDNLVTGRNVPLDDAHLINGTCANFLPFHTNVDRKMSVEELLQTTQAAFWTATENGFVSLGEIYDALSKQDSKATRAKCLFCFQPFEAEIDNDPMRWIVMKKSEKRMVFNYAIQLEIRKGTRKGEYSIRLEYDERVFGQGEASVALDWYTRCLKSMTEAPYGLVLGLGL